MFLARRRTQLKNRIHSVIDKYGLHIDFQGISDIFGKKGRCQVELTIKKLPQQTAFALELILQELDETEAKIVLIEKRMKQLFNKTEQIGLLMTLPGVGFILAVVILTELGDIDRFARAEKLAGYSGMVPRVHSSGGKTRHGPLRNDVNHYRKWAFSEAGNSVAVNHKRKGNLHVSKLYKRIRFRRGHAKAVGAVGRHLAEACFWVLKKNERYKECSESVCPTAV